MLPESARMSHVKSAEKLWINDKTVGVAAEYRKEENRFVCGHAHLSAVKNLKADRVSAEKSCQFRRQ
jgi:hypothetical protein